MKENGFVYLVGAGPGDPGLITVKGKELLQHAEVVLYDKLVNPELLSFASSDAEMIFVGKESGRHYVKQERIIEILIEKAKDGKNIVRLKGGDSLIFGRGSEEAQALRKAEIGFEFVPGITAAIGASAYAGIPLTHRNKVVQCIFITAHEATGKGIGQVDWPKLAQMQHTTLVIYMGASKISGVTKTLMNYGMYANKPAAIIENGTLANQRTHYTTVKKLAKDVKRLDFKPPLVFVIGCTVNLHKDLEWFKEKPLTGKRVVVTRASDQAGDLYSMLGNEGADVVPFPVIRTTKSSSKKSILDILKKNYDWIVFSSENGVRYFFNKLKEERLDARVFGTSKVASIGSSTASKLSENGILADMTPSVFTSACMIKELSEREELAGKSILRIKGYFKEDPLTDGLKKAGANVDTMPVYELSNDSPEQYHIDDLNDKGADAVFFTSMSTVNNFWDLMGEKEASDIFRRATPIAIGPVTASALKGKGVHRYEIADVQTVVGMMDKLKFVMGR